MHSKVAVVALMVLASVVARQDSASACSTTEADTDTVDKQMFMCQGSPNPLPDPITQQRDPRPSIFFAQYGRTPIAPPTGCDAPGMLAGVIFPSRLIVPGPDPSAISGTGDDQWSFFIQDNDRWHLDSNEWSGNGKSDTVFYDYNQPYSKILNAAYLVWFGLKDDDTKLFHGTADYVDLSRANSDDYHSEFFRSVHDDNTYDGEWDSSFVGDDEVQSTCRDYSATGGGENNVVFRVGDTLHEAWHAWQNLWISQGATDHLVAANVPDCQPPNHCDCTIAGDSCDPFYTHTLDAFRPFGTLDHGVGLASDCGPLPQRDCVRTIDPNKFHSPNQIGWEFQCDLLVSPSDWVTEDLLSDAATAQNLFAKYFIHDPPVQCGSNDPMMGPG